MNHFPQPGVGGGDEKSIYNIMDPPISYFNRHLP